jgi:hypothetical protein
MILSKIKFTVPALTILVGFAILQSKIDVSNSASSNLNLACHNPHTAYVCQY